jgi:hypothetical protein
LAAQLATLARQRVKKTFFVSKSFFIFASVFYSTNKANKTERPLSYHGLMFLLTKRPRETDYQPRLPQDAPHQVFYEVFPDDTTGLNKRRDYSFGQAP